MARKRDDLHIRLDPEQKRAFEEAAARMDLTLAAWVRVVCWEAARKAADGQGRG